MKTTTKASMVSALITLGLNACASSPVQRTESSCEVLSVSSNAFDERTRELHLGVDPPPKGQSKREKAETPIAGIGIGLVETHDAVNLTTTWQWPEHVSLKVPTETTFELALGDGTRTELTTTAEAEPKHSEGGRSMAGAIRYTSTWELTFDVSPTHLKLFAQTGVRALRTTVGDQRFLLVLDEQDRRELHAAAICLSGEFAHPANITGETQQTP